MTKPKILTIALIAALLSMIFGKFLTGCGLERDKVVVIEGGNNPPVVIPDDPQCGGDPVSSTRKLECPSGERGEIVEVCGTDGAWHEASNTCTAGCVEDVPSWENDIKGIIARDCVECHGGYLNYANVKAIGASSIGGAGGQSKLAYYITLPESNAKSMPKNRPNLPADDIERILSWIEHGLPESGNCGVDSASISLDYIESNILSFLSNIPSSSDKQNYRFFALSHKAVGGADITKEYQALNAGLNSISFDNNVELCRPIDSKGVVCAIDIRSLKKTKSDFKLIEDADEIKFISNTTKGQIIRQLSGTDQPMFHHDVFLDTVYDNQDLYYQILGFTDLVQMLDKFGINFKEQVAANEYKLIGTNESEISVGRNTRLNAIFEGEVNGFDTACHISFDNPALGGADRDLFQSPFIVGTNPAISNKIFNFEASEVICGLPNRFHAYALFNNQGVLQAAAPENIVVCNRQDTCIDATIKAGIDCMNCHADGYIPMVDVVKESVLSSVNFNNDEVRLIRLVYQDLVGNAATFNLHNGWFQQATDKIGRVVGEKNHFIAAYNNYQDRQSLEQVAAFLFTTPDVLRACIGSSQNLTRQLGSLLSGNRTTHDTIVQALPDLIRDCELAEDPVLPQ